MHSIFKLIVISGAFLTCLPTLGSAAGSRGAAGKSEQDPIEALSKRRLMREQIVLDGAKENLGKTEQFAPRGELAEAVLGEKFTFEGDFKKRSLEAGSSLDPQMPLRITPNDLASPMNPFHELVIKVVLVDSSQLAKNGAALQEMALKDILAARETELSLAKSYKGREIAEKDDRERARRDLVAAQAKVQQEEERLKLAMFHLRTVREYLRTTNEEIATLRTASATGESSQNSQEISKLQQSMQNLCRVLHAIYDFNWRLYGSTTHFGSEADQLRILGGSVSFESFEIDSAYLAENKAFSTALKALLYKKGGPQLVDALEKRITTVRPAPKIALVSPAAPATVEEGGAAITLAAPAAAPKQGQSNGWGSWLWGASSAPETAAGQAAGSAAADAAEAKAVSAQTAENAV